MSGDDYVAYCKNTKGRYVKCDVCFYGDFREDLKEFALFPFLQFPCLHNVTLSTKKIILTNNLA